MIRGEHFVQQLDAKLGGVEKEFRFALATPQRFQNAAGGKAVDAAWTVLRGDTKSTSGELGPEGDAAAGESIRQSMEGAAFVECSARVSGLDEWLQRTRRGIREGNQCFETLRCLSSSLESMLSVTQAVRQQSDNLSSNASILMVKKAKLERVQAELEDKIRHFMDIDDLSREAVHPMLSATSVRFSVMMQDIADEMQFLSNSAQFKSAKAYATKLALAQQRALLCLKDAVVASLQAAQGEAMKSDAFGGSRAPPLRASQHGVDLATSSVGSRGNSMVNGAPPEDEASFFHRLATLNALFVAKLEGVSSLRRMMEMYCGPEADDVHLNDTLAVYRDVRLLLVGDPLRRSLRAWSQSSGGGGAAVSLPWRRSSSQPLPSTSLADSTSSVPTTPARGTGGPDGGEEAAPEPPATTLCSLVQRVCLLLGGCLREEKVVVDQLWLREDVNASSSQKVFQALADEAYQVFRSHLVRVDSLGDLSEAVRYATDTRSVALEDGAVALADVLMRMIQDAQERIIFRTSVYLRQEIQLIKPTVDDAQRILQSALAPLPAGDATLAEHHAHEPHLQLHPVMDSCVHLINTLYLSVQGSVFSTFAEEAISQTLVKLALLRNLMAELKLVVPNAPLHATLCHLCHLFYLREKLARIEGAIVVVEKSLDLSLLSERRLVISQSSRESKTSVESEMKRCCELIIQIIIDDVSTPLVGVASKSAENAQHAVVLSENKYAANEALLARYIPSSSTRSALLRPVRDRLDELHREVGVQQEKNTESTESSAPAEPQ